MLTWRDAVSRNDYRLGPKCTRIGTRGEKLRTEQLIIDKYVDLKCLGRSGTYLAGVPDYVRNRRCLPSPHPPVSPRCQAVGHPAHANGGVPAVLDVPGQVCQRLEWPDRCTWCGQWFGCDQRRIPAPCQLEFERVVGFVAFRDDPGRVDYQFERVQTSGDGGGRLKLVPIENQCCTAQQARGIDSVDHHVVKQYVDRELLVDGDR